jgi:hypothetical protein
MLERRAEHVRDGDVAEMLVLIRLIPFKLTGGPVADCAVGAELLERLPQCDIFHGDNGYDANSRLHRSDGQLLVMGPDPKEGAMSKTELSHKELRRRFGVALWKQLLIVWPIVSALVLIQLMLGFIAGYQENWSLGESIYFAFITGNTIGYGDIVPKHFLSRLSAIAIGFDGVVLMGLIAAIAVRALHESEGDEPR